jgi:AcrR family transcriptional regulator
MTTSLRDRRRQQLRDEILQAAQQLIAERGFAAMSMDELAAQAGISKPTLYLHFSSKEHVVAEVAVNRMQLLIEYIDQVPQQLTPFARLLHVLRKIVSLHVAERALPLQAWSPDLFRIVCENDEARAGMRTIDSRIRALVEAAIAHGEIDAALTPDAVVLTFHALGAASRLPHMPDVPWHIEQSAFIESIMTIFERGVRAAESREP